MKPLPRIRCRCGRAFATSRCEDRNGVCWLCEDCVRLWWKAFFDRLDGAADARAETLP